MSMFLCVLMLCLCLIFIWVGRRFEIDSWGFIVSICTSVTCGVIFIACGCLLCMTNLPFFKEQARIEYNTRLETIMNMTGDGCRYNTVEELAQMVSEYNADVRKGRNGRRNWLLKDYYYDFYDELELVEFEKYDGE